MKSIANSNKNCPKVYGYVFAIVDGKYCVLATVDGPGQYWTIPSTPIVGNKSDTNCLSNVFRDTYKIDIKPSYFHFRAIVCNPIEFIHSTFLGKVDDIPSELVNMMNDDKMPTAMWINTDYLRCYDWDCGIEKMIKGIMPSKWKRYLIRFLYKFKKVKHKIY